MIKQLNTENEIVWNRWCKNSEKYPDKSQAARRESYLKGLNRNKKEGIVVGSLRPDSNPGSV